MKDTIIFATTNEGKLKEIRDILCDLDYEVISMKEAGISIDIVEDGSTYEDNAIIKAKTIMEMTGKIVLADDSGLEVDAMDKAPGIYSARFLGENTSYDIKNNYIIDQLKDVTGEDRSARFVCAIACAYPNGEIKTTRGVIEGYIGHKITGENGFGYDPIFMVPQFGCSSAELSPEMKNQVSHRGLALEKMKEILRGVK
ncbi:MAG: XTP/dITP diphosphatase [Anaerocolumna sp.]